MAAALAATVLGAGCGGGGGGDGNAGATGGAEAAPAVTYVTPSNNAAGVGTNSPVTVSFSKPMNRESLDAAITLVDAQTGAALPLQGLSYDAENKIATVTPLQPLQADGRVRATVSTAAKDAGGNAMDADYAWTFGTAAGTDTTAPEVSSHSPADGAAGVKLNTHVAMSFSEPMNAVSLQGAFGLSRAGVAVPGKLATSARPRCSPPLRRWRRRPTTSPPCAARPATWPATPWSRTTPGSSRPLPAPTARRPASWR
jgi:hypothetical protein